MEVFEILKYTVPAIVVLAGVYFLVAKFLEEERIRMQTLFRQNMAKQNQKIALPLRLQAYERIAVLLERMHPNSLVTRIREPQMNVADFRAALVKSIRSEFEYNQSQQIYVSRDIWVLMIEVKDQMINLVHQLAEKLPAEASSIELAKAILNYTFEVEKGQFPTEVGLKYLKDEVATLY
jgi:hypothetical protein